MSTIHIESSSDSDDSDDYLNSVARLKAWKKHPKINVSQEDEENEIKKPVVNLAEQNPSKNPDCLPTSDPVIHGPRVLRSRSNNQLGQGRRGRSQRQRQQVDRFDSDLEIVSVEGLTEICSPMPQPSPLDDSFTFNDEVILVDDANPGAEDDDYEIAVKVLWRSKGMHRLNMKKNETFRKVFQFFVEKENVPISKILLMRKDQVIVPTDTPASINLSIIDILEGGLVQTSSTVNDTPDTHLCKIKVQTTSKKSIVVTIRKDEEFVAVFEQVAKELEVDESKIKFSFDGETIDRHDTPDSLDLENEACFDLRVAT